LATPQLKKIHKNFFNNLYKILQNILLLFLDHLKPILYIKKKHTPILKKWKTFELNQA